MNSQVPRIALPEPTANDHAYNQRSLPQYVHAIAAAGGLAVPISLAADRSAQEGLGALCSAILLPGSPADVDPARYGELPVAACAAPDARREWIDNILLADAFRERKPVFGVCFGLQSLNVWRGGTLLQDLPQSPPAMVNHEAGREIRAAHQLDLSAGTRLACSLGDGAITEPLYVNSSHHQAVHQPGQGLLIAARSPLDGVIESLEGLDPRHFVIAVQWHPERSYEESAFSRAIFEAFVSAARSWNPATAA